MKFQEALKKDLTELLEIWHRLYEPDINFVEIEDKVIKRFWQHLRLVRRMEQSGFEPDNEYKKISEILCLNYIGLSRGWLIMGNEACRVFYPILEYCGMKHYK